MIRKKIGKEIDAPIPIYRVIQKEFGVCRQTVKNAFTYRSYSQQASEIRNRALELGAQITDRYIWVENERATV